MPVRDNLWLLLLAIVLSMASYRARREPHPALEAAIGDHRRRRRRATVARDRPRPYLGDQGRIGPDAATSRSPRTQCRRRSSHEVAAAKSITIVPDTDRSRIAQAADDWGGDDEPASCAAGMTQSTERSVHTRRHTRSSAPDCLRGLSCPHVAARLRVHRDTCAHETSRARKAGLPCVVDHRRQPSWKSEVPQTPTLPATTGTSGQYRRSTACRRASWSSLRTARTPHPGPYPLPPSNGATGLRRFSKRYPVHELRRSFSAISRCRPSRHRRACRSI